MKPIAVQDVVIAEEIVEEVTKGGIILPDPHKPGKGKVIAVGPGLWNQTGKRNPLQVEVGNIIHYKQSGFIKYSDEHRNLAILREADILFIEGAD